MSWMLRRSRPLAKQGRSDDFGREENPPRQPWVRWGAGSPAYISGGYLYLGYNRPPGWFQPTPDGGWFHEFQPLTANYEYTLSLNLDDITTGGSTKRDEGLEVFLGPGWTSNLVPSNQRFTLCVKAGHWTTPKSDGVNHHFGVRMQFRDSETWLGGDQGGKSWSGWTASTVGDNHALRIRMIDDHVLCVDVDGVNRMVWDIAASGDWPNYRTGPDKRCLGLRMDQATAQVWGYSVYDYTRPPLAVSGVLEFSDDFNRGNSTTIGNSWVSVGSNVAIVSRSLGIEQSFPTPSDGNRGAYRSVPVTSGNMYLAAVFGGGGNLDATRPTTICCRTKSNGTGPFVGFEFYSGRVRICRCDGSPSNPNVSAVLADVADTFNNGEAYQILVFEDRAWVCNQNWSPMAYAEGLLAFAPTTQRHYGASFNRSAFFNSGYLNSISAHSLSQA